MKIVMLAQIGSVHTARWCAALLRHKHDITVISNSWKQQDIPGVRNIYLSGFSTRAYFSNIPRVKKLIKEIGPDIVHSHYATGFGLWGSMQSIAPLVVSVWGTDIVDAGRKKLVGLVTRRTLKKARLITATSQYLANKTAEFCSDAKNKLEIVPFGITMPEDDEITNSPSNEAVTFIFAKIYLANYAPEMVIQAFADARDKMPPARLNMFGGGPLWDKMKRLAHNLGVDDVVNIVGSISHQQAAKEIMRSDIMVMPSYNESFGVAAVEASASALPVIATNVGGIPEIIKHDETGILIEPGNCDELTAAMIRLANDADLRRKMGRAGREFVRTRFTETICLDKMEAVYQRVRQG
ncbi:MAG: glycosyltransferase [Candidatus Zixiibacteriota bacterium]